MNTAIPISKAMKLILCSHYSAHRVWWEVILEQHNAVQNNCITTIFSSKVTKIKEFRKQYTVFNELSHSNTVQNGIAAQISFLLKRPCSKCTMKENAI